MAIKYSQKVIKHFTDPQNVGEIAEADAIATQGSPACGDMITFTLKINPETRVIEDVKFRSFGCASNIATASMTTLLAKGKTIDEVNQLKHRDLTQALDGLPAVKMHCSVLAIDALKSAVHNWELEHGLVEEKPMTLDRESVEKVLTDCLNPRNGISLIEARLIKKIEVIPEDGRVFIEVILCELDELYAEAIEEEISEKIQTLPGVRNVLVQFVRCIHSVG